MPQLLSSSYTTTTVSPEHWVNAGVGAHSWADHKNEKMQRLRDEFAGKAVVNQPNQPEKNVSARIVKVFVADADENVPLDKRVLYAGDERLTDATNQELYYEIPMGELLKKHNEYRTTLADKKATAKSGKDVMLEPIRIRDLKMIVVTVAGF